MSNYDWAEYPQPRYDNAGLEVQQPNRAQLPNAPVPAQLSAPLPYVQEKPSKTICGIPKKAFWTLVVVVIAVVLAGIGGGLAARFAGQHKTQSPPQNPVGASIQPISSTTASLQPQSKPDRPHHHHTNDPHSDPFKLGATLLFKHLYRNLRLYKLPLLDGYGERVQCVPTASALVLRTQLGASLLREMLRSP